MSAYLLLFLLEESWLLFGMLEGADIQESEPYQRKGVGLLPNLVVALIGDWASHGVTEIYPIR